MAEKDENLREEIERNKEETGGTGTVDSVVPEQIKSNQTEVKNANAAGVGSMGRSNENELVTGPATKKEEAEKY